MNNPLDRDIELKVMSGAAGEWKLKLKHKNLHFSIKGHNSGIT